MPLFSKCFHLPYYSRVYGCWPRLMLNSMPLLECKLVFRMGLSLSGGIYMICNRIFPEFCKNHLLNTPCIVLIAAVLFISKDLQGCKMRAQMIKCHGCKLQVSSACSGLNELELIHIGIHGRPYIPWNSAQQTFGAPRTGYCTHCKCYLNLDFSILTF